MAQYKDVSAGDPALGCWLEQQFRGDPSEIRIQTGYIDPVASNLLLWQVRRRLTPIHLVVGSCGGGLSKLAMSRALQASSHGGSLVVVHYADALFHSKTYHLSYEDGRECAAVGSANFTLNGLGRNDEAYTVLDGAGEGDAEAISRVKSATDRWRRQKPPGAIHVEEMSALDRFTNRRVSASSGDERASSSSEDVRRRLLWRPPAFETGKASDPPIPLLVHESVPTVVAEWRKVLEDTDAQRNTGNNSGKLRLSKGDYDIDSGTYFRFGLFGVLPWRSETRRVPHSRANTEPEDRPHDVVEVPFEVTWSREQLGVLRASNKTLLSPAPS